MRKSFRVMRRNWCLRIGILLALTACGGSSTAVTAPEPNLTGLWSSTAAAGQYFDIRMQLTESNAGTIGGQWTATVGAGGGGVNVGNGIIMVLAWGDDSSNGMSSRCMNRADEEGSGSAV